MKKFIGLLLSLIVIAIVAFGVFYPDSMMMSAVVAIVWAFIQVGTVYAVIGMCLLYMAERLTEPHRRETVTELRRLFCQRNKYSISIFNTWCECIVIVVGLVLTGWPFTASSFILVVVMMVWTRHTISQSAGKWTAC